MSNYTSKYYRNVFAPLFHIRAILQSFIFTGMYLQEHEFCKNPLVYSVTKNHLINTILRTTRKIAFLYQKILF